MRKNRLWVAVVVWVLLVLPVVSFSPSTDKPQVPRPIELADILAWKSIRSATLSDDGQWFAYRLAPPEGESEIVARHTTESRELRFPAGEIPPPPEQITFPVPPTPSEISFSADSRWTVFTIYPPGKEVKRLRRENKPIHNTVGLVELSTGKEIEFEKIKKAVFSGQNPRWLALHRYPGENQGKDKDKWSGSDLILRDLDTGAELNVGNVAEFAFDKKGRRLAWIVDAQEKTGNGVQLRDLSSAAVSSLDSGKALYKRLNWTEKGDALAFLKGVEDKAYEDPLYSLVAFADLDASVPRKITYDPKDDSNFPAGMTIAPHRDPVWLDDLSGILFGIHETKKKDKDAKDDKAAGEEGKGETAESEPSKDAASAGRAKKDEPEKPDLVIWHWLDKRLQSQQQVEENRDKNFSFLCIYRVEETKFIRLADDDLRQVTAAPEYRFAVGLDNSDYQLMGNLHGQRFQDIYAIDLSTGERRLAVKKNRWYFGPSPDGTHFLSYDDGHYFAFDMVTGKAEALTQQVPASFVNLEDDHNVVKPPVVPFGWVKDSASVLLSDKWDVWNVPIHGGQALNLTVNGKKEQIRYRNRFRLDPEEKGIDLSQPVYLGAQAEWTKKSGIARIDGGKPGARMLLWEDAGFSTLLKAKSADTFLHTRETYRDFPDYYATDSSLQSGTSITEANPQQKQFLWSAGSRLVDYTSAKGDKLQAALFLPANYEPGKSYPTIVYIYEKLSSGLNRYYAPSANGFNKSVYTSHGYAVLMPDIVYKVNDPGMSAVWCVLPALKAAIATGVVDPRRVGLHGHSWGGYQTSFLITQTEAFRAAVAGAPLTNMISMYSSIYWNTGSANQPIFESSQGRFTGGYWEILEAYARNSPVYFSRHVKTPLLLLHNDKDGAVDWNQGIEYYNTLRRLQKPVVMLQYKGENHGLRKPANQKDYTVRMKEFFDHHLMDKPAPDWLRQGVPHLKLKDHLEARRKETSEPARP